MLFDNGAGGTQPGYPYPGFERSFARFPIPGTQARSWYLGNGGALAANPARSGGADRLRWSKHALPATDFTGADDGSAGGLWTATPTYHWLPSPAGTAAAYLSRPLHTNTTVIGAGAVHLWIKASRPSVDLQVTLTEVRPRWQGDLRPERLAARGRTQARRGPEHAAGAGAQPQGR